VRPHSGEVGECFWVDFGEGLGTRGLNEGANRGRGGIAGIVPTGERRDHDRVAQ